MVASNDTPPADCPHQVIELPTVEQLTDMRNTFASTYASVECTRCRQCSDVKIACASVAANLGVLIAVLAAATAFMATPTDGGASNG